MECFVVWPDKDVKEFLIGFIKVSEEEDEVVRSQIVADMLKELEEYLVFDLDVPIIFCDESDSDDVVDQENILLYLVDGFEGVGKKPHVYHRVQTLDIKVYKFHQVLLNYLLVVYQEDLFDHLLCQRRVV